MNYIPTKTSGIFSTWVLASLFVAINLFFYPVWQLIASQKITGIALGFPMLFFSYYAADYCDNGICNDIVWYGLSVDIIIAFTTVYIFHQFRKSVINSKTSILKGIIFLPHSFQSLYSRLITIIVLSLLGLAGGSGTLLLFMAEAFGPLPLRFSILMPLVSALVAVFGALAILGIVLILKKKNYGLWLMLPLPLVFIGGQLLLTF